MLEHRLYIAVSGCRRRVREQRMEPTQAAQVTATMMDVPAAQVLRLAITAENACVNARLALRQQEAE